MVMLVRVTVPAVAVVFFFNDTATTEIYTLSLHDALPISVRAHHHIPVLDLTVPATDQVEQAIAAISNAERPVLVCCALGYSRSATVAAAWLVRSGDCQIEHEIGRAHV